MTLANMKVYDEQIRLRTIELLDRNIQVFNEASGGALVLSSTPFQGDFSKESWYANIAGAKRRVDRYIANNPVAATQLSEKESVAVKIAGGFGPIVFEPSQLTWLSANPEEAITNIASGFAEALLADQLDSALAAAVAAISNNPLATNRDTTVPISQGMLVKGHAKFGDAGSMLTCDVMHSNARDRLLLDAVNNVSRLFVSSNVQVLDILGKRFVVTDSPALYQQGNPNQGKVLHLVAGGVVVDNAGDIITNMETNNGNQRIETTWQADYSFGLMIKGYSWDIANGGKSPNDTEIATGANWDLVKPTKQTAGAITIYNADM